MVADSMTAISPRWKTCWRYKSGSAANSGSARSAIVFRRHVYSDEKILLVDFIYLLISVLTSSDEVIVRAISGCAVGRFNVGNAPNRS